MGCQEPGRSPSSSLPSPQPPSPLSGLSPSAHFAEALPGQFQAAALTSDGDPRPGPQTPRQRASLLPAEGARGGAPRMAARSRRAVRTPHPAPDPPPRVPALRAAPSSLLQPNRPRGTEFRPTSGRARDPPLRGVRDNGTPGSGTRRSKQEPRRAATPIPGVAPARPPHPGPCAACRCACVRVRVFSPRSLVIGSQ